MYLINFYSENITTLKGEDVAKIRRCQPSERAQLLQETCQTMGIATNTNVKFYPKQILVVDEHKLVVCLPAKAGSSNFKDVLIKNSKRYKQMRKHITITQEELHTTETLRYFGIKSLNDYKRDDRVNILNQYSKVLVVRNPMVRVYSSYREKLVRRFENETCERHRKHMAPWIAHIVRPNSTDAQPGTCPRNDITFEEFMVTFEKYPTLHQN